MSESTLIVEKDVAIPMRDGTLLRADVYRPATGTHPVVFCSEPRTTKG